jgi:hypothetical protein
LSVRLRRKKTNIKAKQSNAPWCFLFVWGCFYFTWFLMQGLDVAVLSINTLFDVMCFEKSLQRGFAEHPSGMRMIAKFGNVFVLYLIFLCVI